MIRAKPFLLFALLLLVALPLVGCGGKGKVYGSLNDVEPLIQGKNQKEVVGVLGKPDFVNPIHYTGSDAYETWTYHDRVTHEATGKLQGLLIEFGKDGNVINVRLD